MECPLCFEEMFDRDDAWYTGKNDCFNCGLIASNLYVWFRGIKYTIEEFERLKKMKALW